MTRLFNSSAACNQSTVYTAYFYSVSTKTKRLLASNNVILSFKSDPHDVNTSQHAKHLGERLQDRFVQKIIDQAHRHTGPIARPGSTERLVIIYKTNFPNGRPGTRPPK